MSLSIRARQRALPCKVHHETQPTNLGQYRLAFDWLDELTADGPKKLTRPGEPGPCVAIHSSSDRQTRGTVPTTARVHGLKILPKVEA